MGRYGGRRTESLKVQAALVNAEPLSPEERAEVINGRPRTRAECCDGPRPCPWVACRYHLALDVTPTGTIVIAHDDPTQMEVTCALDVAEAGGVTLEVVGGLMGFTRERSRQIEARLAKKLREAVEPLR